MAHSVYIDRAETGAIVVSWYQGAAALKSKEFAADERVAAERFAEGKMNKRNGMLISSLDMTAEQLAAKRERDARSAAFLAELRARGAQ